MRFLLSLTEMSYHYQYNRTLLKYSNSARKNQTNAEEFLWYCLRNRQLQGYKFRRQYPVNNFTLDFYCVESKLAIELDGSQHIKRRIYDEKRSKILQNMGITVVRFWDNEVLQSIDEVLETIINQLQPHPNPLLRGEGKGVSIS